MQDSRLYVARAARRTAVFMCLSILVMTGASYASEKGLEVKWPGTEKACVFYDGKVLFAFGPMDELWLFAVKVGSKSYDVRDWAKWQKTYGMNYVRCYPQSGWGWCPLEADGRIFPFRIVQREPLKFDVSVFNEEYWQNFRQVCRILKEHGIIVHLQLFQLCYFEVTHDTASRWSTNFWNPANNINEFTRNLKPNGNGHHPFIEQPFEGNDQLRAHQRQYLRHILEAVGDLGNVFLDMANEMGDDGVDVDKAKQWINWINQEIKQWERATGHNILVGMDYTHFPYGRKLWSLADKQWLWGHPDMELIIDHGNHLPQYVIGLRRKYGKPVMLVNSIDYGGEDLLDRKDITYGRAGAAPRFRRFHWRGMMAKAQGLGGYAYPKTNQPQFSPWSDRQMGEYARIQREFWRTLDYANLLPTPEKIKSSPAQYAYCLSSNRQVVVYLEGPHAKQGVEYHPGKVALVDIPVDEGQLQQWSILHPTTGEQQPVQVLIESDRIVISTPAFMDDLVIYGG